MPDLKCGLLTCPRLIPAVLSMVLCCGAQCALAITIYESGTVGPIGVTNDDLANELVFGTSINEFVFAGARFQVAEKAVTSQIGGHFLGRINGTSFFGGIVRLDNEFDFPDTADLSSSDVLGVTTLTFPEPSAEVFGQLSTILEPGWYAVVFGSGLFGTNGRGGAVRNGHDIGNPTYIVWQPSIPGAGWADLSTFFANHRFVVEGKFIPEPTSLVLAFSGFCYLVFFRRLR